MLPYYYNPNDMTNIITFKPYILLKQKKKCAGEANLDLMKLT